MLAAAYANRGIIRDRLGDHEAALADYVRALHTDAGCSRKPALFDRIIYGYRPPPCATGAIYLAEQLQLPEDQRVMLIPERTPRQRMYKPGRIF